MEELNGERCEAFISTPDFASCIHSDSRVRTLSTTDLTSLVIFFFLNQNILFFLFNPTYKIWSVMFACCIFRDILWVFFPPSSVPHSKRNQHAKLTDISPYILECLHAPRVLHRTWGS